MINLLDPNLGDGLDCQHGEGPYKEEHPLWELEIVSQTLEDQYYHKWKPSDGLDQVPKIQEKKTQYLQEAQKEKNIVDFLS